MKKQMLLWFEFKTLHTSVFSGKMQQNTCAFVCVNLLIELWGISQ